MTRQLKSLAITGLVSLSLPIFRLPGFPPSVAVFVQFPFFLLLLRFLLLSAYKLALTLSLFMLWGALFIFGSVFHPPFFFAWSFSALLGFRTFASIVTSPPYLAMRCYALSSCLSLLFSTMYALLLRALLFGSLVSYCACGSFAFPLLRSYALPLFVFSSPLVSFFNFGDLFRHSLSSLSLVVFHSSFVVLASASVGSSVPSAMGSPSGPSQVCFLLCALLFLFRYFFGSLSCSAISPLHSLAVMVPPFGVVLAVCLLGAFTSSSPSPLVYLWVRFSGFSFLSLLRCGSLAGFRLWGCFSLLGCFLLRYCFLRLLPPL